MLKICKENKQSILEKVKNGHLDTASLCSKNLIDEIILAMYTKVFQIKGLIIRQSLMILFGLFLLLQK